MHRLTARRSTLTLWAAIGLLCALSPTAQAVPSFARQTGVACEACHTVFPELTHFGRLFKANGYVLDTRTQVKDVTAERQEMLSLASLPPLSLMIQASYTQLAKALPDSAGHGSAQNGAVAVPQQVSLFYAGKIAPNLGAFLQLTYENDSGTIGIDNADIRYARTVLLADDQSLIYGLSLNNNPTVQDLWNSTPAFGFPYAASGSAPGSAYATQIDGTRGQDVAGLTAYAFWKESLYGELGLYRSAKQGTASPLDSTSPGGVLASSAPYWRVAYEHNWGAHSLEGGLYGANFKIYPDLGQGYGQELRGPSDHYRDVAYDLQYQYIGDRDLITVTATHITEKQTLDASFNASIAGQAANSLDTTRAFATYYYQRKIGGTAGVFRTHGSTDSLLAPHSPDTQGWVAELNYMPWLNTKFAVQYTAFSKFSGLSTNYDGAGRSARDNNTLYVSAWLSY